MRVLPMRSLLWICLLCPALSLGATNVLPVEVSPSRLLLGTKATAGIRVRYRLKDGEALKARASLGELRSAEGRSGDVSNFVYVPPSSGAPTTAVLLFWLETPSADRFTVVRVPLWGRTELQIGTEPFANVQVQVGDQLFGPVKTNGSGAATVSVEVPPGVRTAQVLAELDGQKTTRSVPLPAPKPVPLASALSPSPVRPQGTALWAVAHSSSLSGRILKVTSNGATATLIDRDKDRAIYLVTPVEKSEQVKLSAEVLGEEGVTTSLDAEVSEAPSGQVSEPGFSVPAPKVGSLIPFAQLGLFFAGEANLGPALNGGVGYVLPVLDGRLLAELEAGLRTAGYGFSVAGLGQFDSRIFAVPLAAGVRFRALQRGPLGVDLRAGLGALLFFHSVSAEFQSNHSEMGAGANGFLSVSSSLRLRTWEPFAELRVGIAPVQNERLNAQLGGISISLGGRFPGS